MNQKEFQQLTYKLTPALKEYFKDNKDEVEVKVLQDTLLQQNNPFNPPALIIGVGYKGTGVMEVYQVTNNGDVAEYKFAGQTRV